MLPVRAADDVKARLREGRSLTIAIGNPYRFSRPTAAALHFKGSVIVTNQPESVQRVTITDGISFTPLKLDGCFSKQGPFSLCWGLFFLRIPNDYCKPI